MFETKRCKIRSFEEKDLDSFMIYRNNDKWMKFQSFKNITIEEYRKALLVPLNLEKWNQIAIVDKVTDSLLGDLFVKKQEKSISIGYSIDPLYAQMGYMTEVLEDLLPRLKVHYPTC